MIPRVLLPLLAGATVASSLAALAAVLLAPRGAVPGPVVATLLVVVPLAAGAGLAAAARALLRRLAATRAALETAEAALEREVRARTDELKQTKERLQRDALRDPLTGLPNRALFLDRLGHVLERAQRDPATRFAVVFLDSNRFKIVNDTLGHAAGDELLAQLARRLRGAVREVDTVARIGGDEFTVLLEDVADLDEVLPVVERIHEAALRPFRVRGQDVRISLSAGVVTSDAAAGDAAEVLRDADLAMYRAKRQGRANTVVFTEELRERSLQRMHVEAELRGAIARDELSVAYQPILAMGDGRPVGVEALVRWRSPRLGELAPAEFLPVAEETGLIVDIDRFVLRRALAEIGARRDDLELSVNLSAQHFLRHDLVDHVRDALRASGFDARRLKFEITESALLRPSPELAATMRGLAELGVELHVDDFGTGHSGLSYLRDFPVRTLKIDRSFVARLSSDDEGRRMVGTIVSMGRALGVDLVAEGIETREQRDAVRALGCEYGQGFLFARPVAARELDAALGSLRVA